MNENWLGKVNWTQNGLVPAIAQEAGSNKVLMLAWMKRDALKRTVETGEAVYWSRSRRKLWRKC
ncbi:MAG: phosphoribosyl-AMP cyclohydrolase, partial [Burkholderiales bacterium]|nr:phosphoribosyl-AMP cyclohydrolase [Burkholderiales bacterium]